MLTQADNRTIIDLPFPPSTNNLFVNVSGRGRVKSSRYRSWLTAAGWCVQGARPHKFAGPVELTMWFGRPGRRRVDLGNLHKGVEDLLVAHGVIEDDSQHVVKALSLVWDETLDGCRVAIQPAQEAA